MTVLLGYDVTPNNTTNLSANSTYAEPFTGLATGTATEAVISFVTVGRTATIVVYDSSNNLLSSTQFVSVSGDNTVTLSTPVPIVLGQTYRLGVVAGSGYGLNMNDSASVWWDIDATATYPSIPDPFVTGSSANIRQLRLFLQDTAPSYTITSIDGDNDVQAGQPNVDIIMTATTGVTSVTLGGETLTINGVS